VDPVLVSAHVIVALQSVVSRSVASKEQAVLSVTMVHGGEVSNVIPDTVTLGGTIRDLNADVCALIYERVRAIVSGTCAAFGAVGTCEFISAYPVVDNHKEQASIIVSLGRRLLGESQVTGEGLPIMGGEDFSYFLQKVPGCFFFFGGKEEALQGWSRVGSSGGQRSNCMCHNTAFDFNDNMSPIASVFWVRLVEHRLGLPLYSEAELPMPLLDGAAADDAEGSASTSGAPGPIALPATKRARAS